jgi:hypothetical protein
MRGMVAVDEEQQGAGVVAPLESWSRAQLEGAARALSVVLVARRDDRGEATYRAAAQMLMDVSEVLERQRAAAAG